MADALAVRAADLGLDNVSCLVADLALFDLPAASVDLIVSNYALHHLRDADKTALVRRACGWLRPGGRLIIADMMFGRGGSARDRQILRLKLSTMLPMGPGGAWRVLKNLIRFGLRVGADRPVPPKFWVDALTAAGFVGVRSQPIVAEAILVTGVAQ
jgi:SAM-dependent methyltransferase